MENKPNFIEIDETALENHLKIISDTLDSDLKTLFGDPKDSVEAPPRDYKIVTPRPGYCIKSFKVNSNEKYFINVCIAEEIPSPEDITEEELNVILQSDEPSNFRIPMSISEPRISKDKSDKPVDVCDIAINPKFFAKIHKSILFKEFFMALITEALSEKFNVQVSQEKTVILNNRKFIGTLVQHRVRNNDVENVINSYKNPTDDDLKILADIESAKKANADKPQQTPLIQEINAQTINDLKERAIKINTSEICKGEYVKDGYDLPDHKFRIVRNDQDTAFELSAEFYLPKCKSVRDINIEMNDDRLVLKSAKHRYYFDKFVNFKMSIQCKPIFNVTSKMLHLRIPIKDV